MDQIHNEITQASLPLGELKQQQCDYLCEEISNFSYLYQTYFHFVCHLVHKHTKNTNTLKQLQKDLQFTQIDDLLNYYFALEKAYICNALTNGLTKEQANLITLAEKETQIEKQLAEGQLDSGSAQSSLEALKDEYPDDLIDDLCLILDKSIKRVSLSLCLTLLNECVLVSLDTVNAQRMCCAELHDKRRTGLVHADVFYDDFPAVDRPE